MKKIWLLLLILANINVAYGMNGSDTLKQEKENAFQIWEEAHEELEQFEIRKEYSEAADNPINSYHERLKGYASEIGERLEGPVFSEKTITFIEKNARGPIRSPEKLIDYALNLGGKELSKLDIFRGTRIRSRLVIRPEIGEILRLRQRLFGEKIVIIKIGRFDY